MNDALKPVTEDELHAFADGQLPDGDIARLEAWLDAHPEDAERIAAWRRQNAAIADMFAPYKVEHPGDRDRVAVAKRRPRALPLPLKTAAAFLLFALGTATGLAIPPFLGSQATATPIFEQATEAFSIYTRDVRHPVEVWAGEKDHLVAWLGKRLGEKLVVPDLSTTGFTLVGGRLVPVDGTAGALLMYEDTAGKRLTVLIGKAAKKDETAFRFASQGTLETLYWVDNGLTYAVTGEVSRDALRQIADDCYRQFQS